MISQQFRDNIARGRLLGFGPVLDGYRDSVVRGLTTAPGVDGSTDSRL